VCLRWPMLTTICKPALRNRVGRPSNLPIQTFVSELPTRNSCLSKAGIATTWRSSNTIATPRDLLLGTAWLNKRRSWIRMYSQSATTEKNFKANL
jgi:hypothetical protein